MSTPPEQPPAEPDANRRSEALTYAGYLRVDELLSLQRPESDEHDELLFIVIHQVYELWFKQLLAELDELTARLAADDLHRAGHTFRRLLTILKTVVAQVDVLETMTPLEFGAFRERLGSASGFQSRQFRELEFALGRKRAALVGHFERAGIDPAPLERRFEEPTLWDAFLAALARRGAAVPRRALERDPTDPLEPDEEVQAALAEVYRAGGAGAELCERMLDLDEGLQEWRYRHVKMVERTIGGKPGTGGSPGAAYLRSTWGAHFPDLWEVRRRL